MINGKEVAVAKLRYYPDICLEELKKTTKTLNQDSRYPGRDSNREPPKYKSKQLSLHQPVR
jgi:hypothetical protein